jgi:hypothetical protein
VNIAAFTSLHVAIVMPACVVVRRSDLRRWTVWALRGFLVITMIDTVYFGWHHASDVVAGVLLGIAGARLAEHSPRPSATNPSAMRPRTHSSVRRTLPVAVRGSELSRSYVLGRLGGASLVSAILRSVSSSTSPTYAAQTR